MSATLKEYFREEWNKKHLQTYAPYQFIDTINIFSQSANSMHPISYERIARIISFATYHIETLDENAKTTLEIIATDNGNGLNYEVGVFAKTGKPFICITNHHITGNYGSDEYNNYFCTIHAIERGYCDECKNYAETQMKLINVVVICEQLNDFDNYDATQIWTNVERVFADIFLVRMIGKF